MSNLGNICHIALGYHMITSLLLGWECIELGSVTVVLNGYPKIGFA